MLKTGCTTCTVQTYLGNRGRCELGYKLQRIRRNDRGYTKAKRKKPIVGPGCRRFENKNTKNKKQVEHREKNSKKYKE